MKKLIIGAEEQLVLPDLGIEVVARIDTGAKTSALHVERVNQLMIDGKRWVQFDIEPPNDISTYAFCLPLLAKRSIRSSNGKAESRPVIKTHLMMNQHRWNIELTLADRQSMQYRMLLGRQAMGKRVLVSPAEKYLLRNK